MNKLPFLVSLPLSEIRWVGKWKREMFEVVLPLSNLPGKTRLVVIPQDKFKRGDIVQRKTYLSLPSISINSKASQPYEINYSLSAHVAMSTGVITLTKIRPQLIKPNSCLRKFVPSLVFWQLLTTKDTTLTRWASNFLQKWKIVFDFVPWPMQISFWEQCPSHFRWFLKYANYSFSWNVKYASTAHFADRFQKWLLETLSSRRLDRFFILIHGICFIRSTSSTNK